MKIVYVIFASLGSIAVLFLLTKLIGNKQMSELNMFDYINGITIGSIAAEMATSLEGDFIYPLIAMIIYAASAILLSFIANKSIKMRRFINGRAIILFQNGKLYKDNLKTAKLDLNEFTAQCRIAGFFSFEDIEAAVLESNGKLSILPKAEKRPVNPTDLQLLVQKESLRANVIIDGKILPSNLQATGNNEAWLKKELSKLNLNVGDVFLATCDINNKLEAYAKISEKLNNDIFE